ncbi:hypothetical protein V1523DRAFT_447976 [Lipomyces doorenjongii]
MQKATVRNASTKYPHLVELNGSGTLCALCALGGGNGIMTHRGPQDSIRVYAAVSTPYEHWASPLQDLLATACDEDTKDNPGNPADISPLYMLPVGHRWEHRTGATLVGDAAHLMTPRIELNAIV